MISLDNVNQGIWPTEGNSNILAQPMPTTQEPHICGMLVPLHSWIND